MSVGQIFYRSVIWSNFENLIIRVDRGEKQIELLLSLLYAFVLYPDRVFLNRGNHEDRVQNSQRNYKPCFKIETLKYFGKHGSVVYNKIDELFRYVPLASMLIL